MSPAEPPTVRRTPSAAFGVSAALVGIVSGAAGVVVARSVFGPGTAITGAAIGLAAGIPASLWFSSARRERRRALRLPSGRRLRRRTHAVGWLGPVSGSVVTVVAWSAVAHSSGSGWVQSVGALLGAVLATGLIAPLFPAMRAEVTCTASPSDVVAGQPASITLLASGPIRVRPLEPPGPAERAGGPSRGRRAVTLDVVPARRGVIDSVAVELASSAPFGLVWWAKEVVVSLPRLLHVAPRTGPADDAGLATEDRSGEAPRRVPSLTGETRGVRPYRAGDLRRAIHWPATAHTGTLMVTESEQPAEEPLVVEVDLPSEPDAAERAAERAMAAVTRHLVRGVPVLLITLEPGGRTLRPVLDRIELGRRLARAVPAGTVPP